jgi:hypothetical protein
MLGLLCRLLRLAQRWRRDGVGYVGAADSARSCAYPLTRGCGWQVAVIAAGRGQLSRVALVGNRDLWYSKYLMQPASAYSLADNAPYGGEGLSSTFPFRDPPYGGPLNLLHQVTRASAGQHMVREGAAAAVPQELAMLRTAQQLCGLDSGCEYHSANNLKTAMDVGKDFKWGKLEPPKEGVLKEVKAAIEDYQKDLDLEVKINQGTATNSFAAKPGQARTQILCGLDAGCEDEMSSEVGIAQKVDQETVMADLPDYPDTDTIDEVWKAVADKRMNEEVNDAKRRGSAFAEA